MRRLEDIDMTVRRKARPVRSTVQILMALAVVATLLTTAGASPASAAPTRYKRNCEVTSAPPWTFYRGGTLFVRANIYVKCARGSYVQIRKELREDDRWPNRDDNLTRTHQRNSAGNRYVFIPAGRTYRFPVETRCRPNEPGVEELFSRSRISVWTGKGWSTWSKDAESRRTRAYCT